MLRYGIATDVGVTRTVNQDSAFAMLVNLAIVDDYPPTGIFVVADGMGGHHDGEQASSITVKSLATEIVDAIVMPHIAHISEENIPKRRIAEVMSRAIKAANETLQMYYPNSGTTATAAVVQGDVLHIAHVGDSRAYLIDTDGYSEVLTRDHSLVKRLIELGQITEEEAEKHPKRNMLYRAIGQGDNLEVDEVMRRLSPGASILLCSDGLWGVVGDEGILATVAKYPDPQQACEELIIAANAKGGPDNITVILVKMPGL